MGSPINWRWFGSVIGLVALTATLLAAFPQAGAAKKPSKPELTSEQKAELREIRKQFSSAKKDLDKQQAAVERAVKAGPHAATPLAIALEKRFKGTLKKYSSSLVKAAKGLGDKRLISTPEDLMESNRKLMQTRKILERTAEMHASLQAVIDSQATSGDAATSGDDAGESAADDKETPTLFEKVPMMEYIALGIGAPGMSQREIDCVLWTNRYRSKHGLRLLRADAKLSDSARMHSKDMVEHDFRSHVSPLPGKENFRDRGKIFGTRADGENIAEAPYTGQEIVDYWLDSPPHKANLDHPKFRRIGVGLHNNVWTQVFGGIDSFKM